MDQINWVVGDERKFSEFISKFNEKDKIAIVSHVADLDGVTAAKVINKAVDANLIKFVDYHEINLDLAKYLKSEKIKFIIMSDLMIRQIEFLKECEKFAQILIIDHHTFEIDYNSSRTTFLNAQGYCAGYLAYYLFSKITDLSKFDWLVASASVSDWCYKNNSAWMIEIYEKYNQKYIPTIEGIKESKFWDIVLDLSRAIVYFREEENDVKSVFNKLNGEEFGNISDLDKYAKIVADEIEKNLENFKKQKIEFNEGYYFEVNSKFPVKSIISTEVSEKNLDKTIIIAWEHNNYLTLSSRRQDGKIDMNKFMQKLIEGLPDSEAGGHFKAVGGYVPVKYRDEIILRLKNL